MVEAKIQIFDHRLQTLGWKGGMAFLPAPERIAHFTYPASLSLNEFRDDPNERT
jgi:hypothetical protein